MELRADATIPFPRAVVFAAYRDDILQLLPYLPNVRNIEIKSRQAEGSRVSFVNVWKGGGDIPAAARAFVSEKMLSWDDIATWDESDFTVAWVIKTHAFSEAVDCHGANRFLEKDPNTTVLEIRGSLTIDGKKIPGVPGFLSNKVGKTVEEMLINKIQPNLVSTTSGLAKFLENRAKA